MGKNLTRLFQDRKDAPFQVAIDANSKLGHLFRDHGEALIAALERLQDECLASDFNEHWDSYTNAVQLLAQLESEAQP